MIKKITKTLMIGSSFILFNAAAFAEAQAPALKLSGFTSIVALMGDQTQKQNGKGGTDPSLAVSASDFRLTVAGKSVTDFGYKYVVNFKTVPGQEPLVNRNYVEFDSNDIGSIQIGVVKGVDDSMVVDTYSIMGGTGGPNKGFGGFNYSEGTIMGTNIVGSTDIATKINWFSPTVQIAEKAGSLQIALSYTPNTSHNGKGPRDYSVIGNGEKGNEGIYNDSKLAPYGLKNIVYGATYKNTINDYTITLNAIGISEHSRFVGEPTKSRKTYALQRTNSYQLSAMLSTGQWDYTASWLDNKKSRLPTSEITRNFGSDNKLYAVANNLSRNQGTAGTSWNVGSRYSFGAYQAALGYFRTDAKTDAINKTSLDAISTTLDFKALEGLKFFGELNCFRTKTNQAQMASAQAYYAAAGKAQTAVGNNTGAILILGTKVSF